MTPSPALSSLSLRDCLGLLLPAAEVSRALVRFTGAGPTSRLDPMEEERAFFRSLELELDGQPSDRGLKSASALRLRAALELGRRHVRLSIQAREESTEAAEMLGRYGLRHAASLRIPGAWLDSPTEWLGFVAARAPQRLGGFTVVARGSRERVTLEPADLFAPLLALRPQGFYLFHNHPSGRLEPSREDLHLTSRVSRMGGELGVPLLGHAIVTRDGATRWLPDSACGTVKGHDLLPMR